MWNVPISHGEIGTDNAEEILALGAVLKNNSAGGTTGTSRHGAEHQCKNVHSYGQGY